MVPSWQQQVTDLVRDDVTEDDAEWDAVAIGHALNSRNDRPHPFVASFVLDDGAEQARRHHSEFDGGFRNRCDQDRARRSRRRAMRDRELAIDPVDRDIGLREDPLRRFSARRIINGVTPALLQIESARRGGAALKTCANAGVGASAPPAATEIANARMSGGG